jgi:serine/threonine protein kinase/Tol biopolymer transport system component
MTGGIWWRLTEVARRMRSGPAGVDAAKFPNENGASGEGVDSAATQQLSDALQRQDSSFDARPGPLPTIPQSIGRYVVLEQLGRGGMGQVFLAHDTELDRPVALKFLSAEAFGGRSGVEMLKREAKALSTLNHPNIVTIHEVIQSGSSFAIVMELIEGKALREHTRAALPPARVAQIGQQIARALAAAHAAGIVHRDIKPENILLRADGYVKVVDFGLARRMDVDNQNSTLGAGAGTVRYMSPEQMRGATVTGASDVFSLGLVLYELVAGRHPFAGTSLLDTAHAIAAKNPAPPSSVNRAVLPRLDALILRMLSKNAASRPAAKDVADLLGSASETGEPVQALAGVGTVSRRLMAGSSIVVGVGAAVYWSRRKFERTSPIEILLDNGDARSPVVSPDGSRIAFSWKPAGAEHFQLALIDAGGGAPRALTTGKGSDLDPAWSADGKQICFIRQGLGESALYITTLRDGSERRLTTLANSSLGSRIDWLRDSRTVVFAENSVNSPLALIDLETRQRRELPGLALSYDTAPRCSPDGKWIAFSRFFTESGSDLLVVGVDGGEPRRLTFDGVAKREVRWSPDGRAILFKARFGGRWGFWAVPFAGGQIREITLPETIVGDFDVRAGRDGIEMVSADHYQLVSICRMDIPGEGQGLSRPVRVIGAGGHGMKLEADPAISPDGLRVAFISFRSGCPEIWVSDIGGDGARQMTFFQGSEVTQPAWSPDARYLLSASAPDGNRNLFLVEVETGAMRWLTTSGQEETEPQWSHDGRWITFASSRSGRQELWRMPAAGGPAHRVTKHGGSVHRESPDGRWLYFVRAEQSGLWRIPFRGGKEELILERVYGDLYRAWAIGRRGVYYTYRDPATARATVALYDPDSRAERPLANFDQPLPRWSGALTVSPDERWMLLPMIEASGSRLVLFRGVKV